MSDRSARRLGARGEDLAVTELERGGMTVLDRNWRCRIGELDVIAAETIRGRTTIVFCEVKCRSGLGFGDPLEAITFAKIRRLRQLAAAWLMETGARPDAIRMDAVGIVLNGRSEPIVRHERGIG
jgi:putative endonuclease